MSNLNLYLRTNKAGVTRALYRCCTVATGAHAVRDAALHLIQTGRAAASDTLRLYRGKVFHRALSVATAAELDGAAA